MVWREDGDVGDGGDGGDGADGGEGECGGCVHTGRASLMRQRGPEAWS